MHCKVFQNSEKGRNRMIKIQKTKIGIWITYIYLLLPFAIFAIGWFGKRYWIPIVFILLFCGWKAGRDAEKIWIPELTKENLFKIGFILIIIFMWVYYSGIGRLVFQNTDHNVRNAVYEVLVSYDWPIFNPDVNNEVFPEGTTATSLIYYIGFWLPSAVVGKIFGIDAGYGFQVFWAILGISLVYYYICARKEKIMIWPLAILIFFSGLDIVGQYLIGTDLSTLPNTQHIEWWAVPYQYSSMTTQLYWVFNQAIPAWLCTIWAFMQKDNKSVVFILSCCMLPGTFPFVGLLLLILFWIFTREYPNITLKNDKKQYIKCWIKDTFTIQNVIGGGIVGIFSFLYLSANISGHKIMGKSPWISYANHLSKYMMFLLIEVGVYFILIYQLNKKNKLYYFLLLCFCIIPPIKVGSAGDFCMRVSIPALFMLMIMVMDSLEKAKKEKKTAIVIGICVTLCVGAVTPLHEISRSFSETVNRLNNGEQLYEDTLDSNKLLNGSNFSGAVNDSFFFQYIAR